MKINVNDYVKIKLTEAGRSELKKQYRELEKEYSIVGHIGMPKEDEDGWSKWQLWRVMQVFGSTLHLGMNEPFEAEIEVEGVGNYVKFDEAALDKLRDAVIDAEYNYLKGLKEMFQNVDLGFDKYES